MFTEMTYEYLLNRSAHVWLPYQRLVHVDGISQKRVSLFTWVVFVNYTNNTCFIVAITVWRANDRNPNVNFKVKQPEGRHICRPKISLVQ